MKVQFSPSLAAQKPALIRLRDRLLQDYIFVGILAVDAEEKRYSISKAGTNISTTGFLSKCGIVIKIYDGSSYAEYSLDTFSEDAIEEVAARIKDVLIPISKDFTANHYEMLSDEPMIFSESTDYELDPAEYGDERVVEKLSAVRDAALAKSEQILDVSISTRYRKYSKLYLSKNKDMEQSVLWVDGHLAVIASRDEEIKSAFETISGVGGMEHLNQFDSLIDPAVNTCLALLDSIPMVPGEYECICPPAVTGMIVHEAFGHGVEMDMFVKDRALAASYIGKQVASPLITMVDGASAALQTATYFFDDEGIPAHETTIIDHGILVSGISDAQSALALGTEPTGNGRRESFLRKAYTRMTNTYFLGGKDEVEDMIASVKYGFQLECPSSGMEDPKNWGIQCMVTLAREIKDGRFTGRVMSPVVLTGYVPDLLKSITMVSKNVELSGSGFCGKGYKEWVKVSDGGPYIKAKIRLG